MDEEEKGGRVLHREAPPQQLSWDGITLPRKGVVRVQCPGGQVRLVVLEFAGVGHIDSRRWGCPINTGPVLIDAVIGVAGGIFPDLGLGQDRTIESKALAVRI